MATMSAVCIFPLIKENTQHTDDKKYTHHKNNEPRQGTEKNEL